jgi:hypothetical protein
MNDVMTDNTFRRLLWYPIFSQRSRVAPVEPCRRVLGKLLLFFSQNLVTF